jgi:hypothetical protein
MPLRWTISPLEHIVVCVFEGVVTLADIVAYFAALEAAGASHYRKILDATRGECSLSAEELGRLAAQTKSSGARRTPGPVAVVTGVSRNDTIVTNLRAMTPNDRRLRMFPNIHDARRWLSTAPLGNPSGHARRPT